MSSDYKTYSDQNLLQMLVGGNEHAFHEIYDRYSTILFKTAFNILSHHQGAEDVVQEIFLSLWRRRSELNVQSVGAYLNRSAWYFALRMYKEEKRDSEFDARLAGISEDISREDPVLFKEFQLILEKIIKDLPDDQKKIFKMSREQNMKYREIADELNISVKTVEKKMSDSLKKIRTELGNLILLYL